MPGYPKLPVGEPFMVKELLGVYTLPNDNHKLTVYVYTDMEWHKYFLEITEIGW